MSSSPASQSMTLELLRMLREAPGYLSGEGAGRALGISRVALGKRVNSLRRKGFEIEGRRGSGYRLMQSPDLSKEALASAIASALGPQFQGEVVYLSATDSTNDIASALATEGCPEGTVVVADTQRAGRGRLGRAWASPPGTNIYMSVVLRPELSPRDATLLTLLGATAAARAIGRETGVEVRIKWPNDLMAGSKKLGGILLETRADPDRISHAVIGFGINVNIPRGAMPREIRETACSIYTQTRRKWRRADLVAAVMVELLTGLESLRGQGRAPLLEAWRALSETLGRRVRVTEDGDAVEGRALDIDDSGRLLLKLRSGKIKTISTGDVSLPSASVGSGARPRSAR